jgi:predicted nucleic acid-binding protein
VNSVLVDSNVILDVAIEGSRWYGWSAASLQAAADSSTLVINPLVYAEVSVGFADTDALDDALPEQLFRRESLPYEAAFMAGKCFLDYKRRGGSRRSPLPDFYIGAHAAVAGYMLLTRDARRYRTYFPSVRLISP